jgi:hypothetical protein
MAAKPHSEARAMIVFQSHDGQPSVENAIGACCAAGARRSNPGAAAAIVADLRKALLLLSAFI